MCAELKPGYMITVNEQRDGEIIIAIVVFLVDSCPGLDSSGSSAGEYWKTNMHGMLRTNRVNRRGLQFIVC